MGLVDTSYQPWSGDLLGRPRRVAAMVRVGLGLAFEGMLTRIVLLMSYTIVVVWIGILYLMASMRVPLPLAVGNNLYREYLNSGPYGLLLMLLTAMVGARLISRDVKTNAVAMYLSKAITRADYVAGKFGVIAIFLLSASFAPSFALWIGQIAMGQETLTWGQRFADLWAITLHSLVIVVPASAAILAFSSMSRTAYVPGILWVLLYLGSEIVGEAILVPRVAEDWCKLVSWRNLTAHVGNAAYSIRQARAGMQVNRTVPVMDYDWWVPAAILGIITAVSLGVVLWRLRKFEGQE
jgi:ABC-type transport system involved in multi-copper enzyme maturation permease subunit